MNVKYLYVVISCSKTKRSNKEISFNYEKHYLQSFILLELFKKTSFWFEKSPKIDLTHNDLCEKGVELIK